MSEKQSTENVNPPEEFRKIIDDFTADILITFPEYTQLISKWWNRPSLTKAVDEKLESKRKETLFVFRHCMRTFPERFFDILYKNAEIFNDDSEIQTEFLPGIVFKQMWNCDITDNTRETIWKYLQLILFSVIGSVNNVAELGDTAKLFEAINEEELKNKLQETLEGMQGLFDNAEENQTQNTMPNAEQLHDHIQSMMGGKLGKLAMELAEETAQDLNLDLENTSTAGDVFQKLFKNPGKMMNMVKNIGGKLDEKIKSGEIKESELMEEGMELLNKMKNMPGMENMQKMFGQMGIPGLGKGAKLNVSAMEAQLNRNMKNAKLKERLRAKAEKSREKADAFCNMSDCQEKPTVSEEELIKIFSTGDKPERTPRGAKPPSGNNDGKKGKKKGKK